MTDKASQVLDFGDYPRLRARFESITGLVPWQSLTHFSHDEKRCWLRVAGREVALPALWYLGDARGLAHYLPLIDLNPRALRAAYRELRALILSGNGD